MPSLTGFKCLATVRDQFTLPASWPSCLHRLLKVDLLKFTTLADSELLCIFVDLAQHSTAIYIVMLGERRVGGFLGRMGSAT